MIFSQSLVCSLVLLSVIEKLVVLQYLLSIQITFSVKQDIMINIFLKDKSRI